jgi:cell fate regulator YaaT (PSP1 superfamily)
MENAEDTPVQPQEGQAPEPEFELRYPTQTVYHPFLSRGCCGTPKLYQKNESVYDHRCTKFDSYDWMKDIPVPPGQKPFDIVEVRFKNSRKDYFRIPPDLELQVGDFVAVEASPGHDIGIVSMCGEMVRFQLRKKNINAVTEEIKKVYRKARLTDLEKWITAVETENKTMFRSREIADGLGLQMKINDVEYQGDNTKAIFYYTAEDRVDFRELIKLMAEAFKVRIEMRQIGARQEASRLGGIGSCGRELCCSTWMGDFKSVTTNSARVQQLSLNPQKLAGQCGKLKCCLNYEYESYVDALKAFPSRDPVLKTKKGDAMLQKTEIFPKLMWFSYQHEPGNMLAIPLESVLLIMEENKKGNLPENLESFARVTEKKAEFDTSVGQEDLTRFDHL